MLHQMVPGPTCLDPVKLTKQTKQIWISGDPAKAKPLSDENVMNKDLLE
jgi:hypothetical protein